MEVDRHRSADDERQGWVPGAPCLNADPRIRLMRDGMRSNQGEITSVQKNGQCKRFTGFRIQVDPVNTTLNILNQRWTLHIVAGLLDGKMRFNEMVRTHGINPCTLRDRLRELEQRGIVSRQVVSSMPPNVEYSLTEKGMALRSIFSALEHWGRLWITEDEPEAVA